MNNHYPKPWGIVFAFLVAAALVILVPQSGFGHQMDMRGAINATSSPPAPTPTRDIPPDTQKALEHIAEREGISIERLAVTSQKRWEFKYLGKSFWVVKALDTGGSGWYTTMLDLADGSFADDVEMVEQAEREAYHAKYGKLDPALYERLQSARDDEVIQVVIWVAGRPRRSQEELYAALAAQYPEAGEALKRSGKPFDVGDPQLGRELETRYMEMLAEDTREQVKPLIDLLRARGYNTTAFDAMPAIGVALPKAFLLEVASRSDVGAIFLTEKHETVVLNSAVPSDRVPNVWQRGFNMCHMAIQYRHS